MEDLISESLKETLIQEYLQSSENRAKLVQSTLGPAQTVLDHGQMQDGSDRPNHLSHVSRMVSDMLRVKAALKGDEKADMTRFLGLLSDLQSLRDRLMSRIRP
ncbi:MAG: hypothetical protein BWY99_02540 [Synergistetes bacterium ADurb.BinA166]|nr:MAG: hypothetical protein BWY99_02540 [Synergistetes bacterium ADurb.BinA166]